MFNTDVSGATSGGTSSPPAPCPSCAFGADPEGALGLRTSWRHARYPFLHFFIYRNSFKTVENIASENPEIQKEENSENADPLEAQNLLNPWEDSTSCEILWKFHRAHHFSTFSIRRRNRNPSKSLGSIDSFQIQKNPGNPEKFRKSRKSRPPWRLRTY